MSRVTFKQTKIQQLREALGYTQDAFAKLLGVSKQAVSQWELGAVVPSLDSLTRIANRTGAKIESFWEEERDGR